MSQSFYDWLSSQAQRQDVVGNLANYAKKDILFPRKAKKLCIFLHRFEGLPSFRLATKKAHAEWRKLRRTHARIEFQAKVREYFRNSEKDIR